MFYECIIVLVCLVSYYSTMRNSHIIDDIGNYRRRVLEMEKFSFKNRIKGGIKGLVRFIHERLYGCCTFTLNIQIDNLFRLSLFALCSVMIYYAFGQNTVSFWAAILYAINPINNQVSMWSNGRRYLINVILVMAMLLLGPLYGTILYPLTLFFHVTALFSVVVYYSPWPLLAMAAMAVIAFPSLRVKIRNRFRMVFDQDRLAFTPKRLVIIIKHYGHFFFKMIFPGVCQLVYSKLYYWGITARGNKDAYSFNRDFYQGIAAIVLSGLLFWILPDSLRGYALFMFIGTLQWCAIIPCTQDLADRYVSVPTAFMMFFVSYLLLTYLPQASMAIISCLIVYYLVNLNTVKRMYRSIWDFFEYQKFYSPDIPSPVKEHIKHLLKEQDYVLAFALCRETLKYIPNDYIMLYQAAVCNRAVGDLKEARRLIDLAAQNYYVGQERIQALQVADFINSIAPPSRQVRRSLTRQDQKEIELANKLSKQMKDNGIKL